MRTSRLPALVLGVFFIACLTGIPLLAANRQEAVRIAVPTNLRVQGYWDAAAFAGRGSGTDVLYWDASPGAALYRVYRYDKLLGATPNAKFTVPAETFQAGLLYTVTAVHAEGAETIPSAPCAAMGAANPSKVTPVAPVAPYGLAATPDTNLGRPRIRLKWRGRGDADTYAVYRDGRRVAFGLWGLNYVDNDVAPGQVYAYSVSGISPAFQGQLEGPQSEVFTAKALPSAIMRMSDSAPALPVSGVTPNDDSALISFPAFPGAADYRCYEVGKEGKYKYSGGSLSIEMNDLREGSKLVIEAVDKPGPFQKMDGVMGPGSMVEVMDLQTNTMRMGYNIAINGQGDPSNAPEVLARSEPVTIALKPLVMSGEQVFLDTFRGSKPFAQVPVTDARVIEAQGKNATAALNNLYVREYQNDKWTVRNYLGDMETTAVFVMSQHLMDTFYDGGTPGTNQGLHLQYSELAFIPKASANIEGGKTLHITFEVDPFFTGRRWCEVDIWRKGDALTQPGQFESKGIRPTSSGDMVQILMGQGRFDATLWRNVDGKQVGETVKGLSRSEPSALDLDKRRRYDVYLSGNKIRMTEGGKVILSGAFSVPVPFEQCEVGFLHLMYHSALERSGLIKYGGFATSYFQDLRPYGHLLHWDNLGFQVLNSMPQ